jgi:chromosome segregation ATPase
MKKLFIVDTDEDFQTQVKSLCPLDQVEVRLFSSSMEIFPLIGKEKPYLVLVNLEVPDVNDFVMYDLLKKSVDNSIPVVATYLNQSEKDLQQYKKMKFQPKEYCIKPISNDDIHRLLQNHLELDEEDDEDFSDENIDRLVRGEYLKTDHKDKDDTKELLADTKNDVVDDVLQSEENEVEIADILKTGEKKTSRADQELRNQVISLERQNEFLRSENKELSGAIEALKADIENGNAKIRQLKSKLDGASPDQDAKLAQAEYLSTQLQEEYDNTLKKYEEEKTALLQKLDTIKNYSQKLENQNTDLTEKLKTVEKEKTDFQNRYKELADQLTDKERELAARNYEFEKSLKDKSDELVQEAEERLKSEFERKQEQLVRENRQLKEEREKNESSLQNEIENLKQSINQLQNDSEQLKKREETLNRTISTLAEEKVTISEKVNTLEETLAGQEEACDEKEKTHLAALESLNKEMEKVLHNLQFYKNRVNELGGLLQQALALTQTENLE